MIKCNYILLLIFFSEPADGIMDNSFRTIIPILSAFLLVIMVYSIMLGDIVTD